MTEAEFQQQVIEAAHLFGWAHLHVRKSIGKGRKWTTATNLVGWPDLFLWHPKYGFAAIELKVGTNRATAEQLTVLQSLAFSGAHTFVAYPDDWPFIESLLRGEQQEVA